MAAYIPNRPPILVDAKDDRIVIDLMRHPKFAKNEAAQRLVRVLAPLVTVSGIESESQHLHVALRPFPDGIAEVIARVRNLL